MTNAERAVVADLIRAIEHMGSVLVFEGVHHPPLYEGLLKRARDVCSMSGPGTTDDMK